MKFSPRTIRQFAFLLLFAALAPSVKGTNQSAARKQAKQQADAKSVEARERRQAVSLLVETAEEARSFADPEYRAEVQALAADALWPADEKSARAIFMRAWAAATDADRAAQAEPQSEEEGDADLEGVASVRFHLLRLVARRDPRLADKLLKELTRDDAREESRGETPGGGTGASANEARADASSPPSRRRTPWREPSPESEWRFVLVKSLMRERAYEHAAQMAAPLADEGASGRLMFLLHDLRAVFPQGAEEIYLRLLERTNADAASDANDVLLVSSYVVSPELLVVVDERGTALFTPFHLRPDVETNRRTEASARVRQLFYRTAASVLLRPSNTDAARGDALARFFAIGRLLPFFEREAPQHAPGLHARRASLTAEIEAGQRERLSAQMQTHTPKSSNRLDPLAPHLNTISRLKTEPERDLARKSAVRAAARQRLFDRARTIAEEIVDPLLRAEARSIILTHRVLSVGEGFKEDEDPNDWERSAAFVRGADVSPMVRALGLAKAADLAARRGKRELASELLREAGRFAEQLERGTLNRYGAFAHLTLAAARTDPQQAWEFLAATASAANEVESFSDLYMPVAVSPEGEIVHSDSNPSETSLSPAEVFATMARMDFARALAEVRTLKSEMPRAYATLAVARARLERGGPGGAQGVRKR